MKYTWMIEVKQDGEYIPLWMVESRDAARLMQRIKKYNNVITSPSRIRRYVADTSSRG